MPRWRCRRARGAHARRSRAGRSPSGGCCAIPIPARRSTATGRSRSPTARCPMSARRSRSSSPTDRYLAEDAAALVAVDYDVLPAVADCRQAGRAGRAGGPARAQQQHRRHLQGRLRRCRRGLRQGRARLPRGALAASRRRPSDRRPRHSSRNGAATTSHDGLGVDAEGARPVPVADRAARLRREPAARRDARRRRRLRSQALRLSRGHRGGGGREARCGARSNGSRTGASISPTRRRSATSIGRSTSRSTPTPGCSASAAG